ncbi:hypothetical protein A374_02424 [Fictibacillus macauensis ZFHKF-1]|uniref:Uncharacterized protein n=1 Tax=Fictibacillus macauensis ZFHKF-1 TaxID=1196324 RepID=I8AM90_9BACL|nr:DUF6143 family protein [Fictibacillus macauensis]EIT87072.1 hypothetical protein A374_02424 [Fictibacillus macauensis ZFHKF-1]
MQEQGISFIGSTQPVMFDKNGNLYTVLYNPKNSGVMVYYQTVTLNNLSGAALSASAGSFGKPEGQLYQSDRYVPGNMNLYGKVQPKSKILYGTNISLEGGVVIDTEPVSPYQTLRVQLGNTVILPPGTNRWLLYTILDGTPCSQGATFYIWREVKIA